MKKTIDIPQLDGAITVDLFSYDRESYTVNLSIALDKRSSVTYSVTFDNTNKGESNYDQ